MQPRVSIFLLFSLLGAFTAQQSEYPRKAMNARTRQFDVSTVTTIDAAGVSTAT